LIEIAVEPRSNADRVAFIAALRVLADEDPTFQVTTDHESGQTILKGTSEKHLADKAERIRGAYNIDCNIGAPQVAFRETITKSVTKDYTHKKETGGTGQFARLKLLVEPNHADKGFAFESKIIGGSIPEEYPAGVEKGLASVLGAGVVAGFPVVDIKVSLVDGAYHEIDSSALAFEIAARSALREALQEAGSVLLEPIMKVEVLTPADIAAPVLRDLEKRRGQVAVDGEREGLSVIAGTAPLQTLFGYDAELGKITAGRGSFTMAFDRYARVPSHVQGDDPSPEAAAMALRA
jgi:elongation factor G